MIGDDPARLSHAMAQDRRFLKKLDAVLEKHFAAAKFDVTLMAAEMAVSERQLQRRVNELAACSPIQYLRRFRLRKSLKYLNKGLPVGQAAAAVGFTSHSYFSACFRREFGYAPTERSQGALAPARRVREPRLATLSKIARVKHVAPE